MEKVEVSGVVYAGVETGEMGKCFDGCLDEVEDVGLFGRCVREKREEGCGGGMEDEENEEGESGETGNGERGKHLRAMLAKGSHGRGGGDADVADVDMRAPGVRLGRFLFVYIGRTTGKLYMEWMWMQAWRRGTISLARLVLQEE